MAYKKIMLTSSSGRSYLDINSLRPRDAYMRQYINRHCFILSAQSHYLNKCWNVVNWTLMDALQWSSYRNSNLFIQENAFENIVWKISAILSRSQCVKGNKPLSYITVTQFTDESKRGYVHWNETVAIFMTFRHWLHYKLSKRKLEV